MEKFRYLPGVSTLELDAQACVGLMGAWNAGPARRIVRQAPSGLLPVWDAPIILFKPGLKEKMRRHVIVWNVADFPIISGH
jgi:hypothetical protein